MDFSIPDELTQDLERFRIFLEEQLIPHAPAWHRRGEIPEDFHRSMGKGGWYGFKYKDGQMFRLPALRNALIAERIAVVSPGVAVAALAHNDLGLMGLWLFGSDKLKADYAESALRGETLICVGNTESLAGSDVANIASRAEKVEGGWLIRGTKAYVTNGLVSDMAIITAVSDAEASRNNRISMFLVDLSAEGVTRKKLNKQVWIPSDLTRIQFERVFVPDDHLLGQPGRGLQQVLGIFNHSRVSISALTLGTALGAFDLALEHQEKRKIFRRKIHEFQAKAFETADLYAKIEAARLLIWRACWAADQGGDIRMEASLAKYTAVSTAREVSAWAADIFGAASVIYDHPVHKFPMDAWASSLGEGTQDVQRLVIFRELMKRMTARH